MIETFNFVLEIDLKTPLISVNAAVEVGHWEQK